MGGACANHLGHISIHALREEGDRFLPVCLHRRLHFYPRPPRGGRRSVSSVSDFSAVFLSTPSARRATQSRTRAPQNSLYFYPRPPRGGRHHIKELQEIAVEISIHALREEGDVGTVLYTSA